MVKEIKAPSKDTQRLNITFDRDDVEYLEREATENGTTLSQIVRRAVKKERLDKQSVVVG